MMATEGRPDRRRTAYPASFRDHRLFPPEILARIAKQANKPPAQKVVESAHRERASTHELDGPSIAHHQVGWYNKDAEDLSLLF